MSFPAYESYKEGGVEWLGRVPSHWEVRRIRQAASLNPSKSEANRLPPDTELSFLPMEAVGERGELDLSRTRPLDEIQQGYTFFGNGDVVFAKVTPCFENGKGALMRDLTHGVGFGTTELTVLRPLVAGSAEYLWWFTSADAFRKPAAAEMVGAGGLKRVPDDYVADVRVPWPPTSEQRAIATFLDRETAKIDALVEAQERLIALLKEKRQAVISHAVTKGLDPSAPMKDSGVEWLGQVPAHWDLVAIKRLAHIRYGIGEPPQYQDDGVPLIRATNVDHGKISPVGLVRVNPADIPERRIVWLEAGDIIVVRSGAYTGDSALVRGSDLPAIAGFDMVMRPFACTAEFLQFALLSSYLKEGQIDLERTRAAQPHLNAEELGGCVAVIPPPLEQSSIADFLVRETGRIDALENEAQAAITLLQERRAALICAAVTGKIDVRGLVQMAEAA